MPEIQKTIEELANHNILVIGDVMLDRYIRGRVDRVSPEAPVPVLAWESTENRLGGAANVALNIKAMGATPILCSVIGNKENSQLLVDLLPKSGISPHYLLPSSTRPTTVKTRIIAANQHLLRVDSESVEPLNEIEEKGLLKIIKNALDNNKIDLILFQDYNKGVLTLSLLRQVQMEALVRNIPTVVDPKFTHFFEYKRCTLFKPNLKEIREALGKDIAPNKTELDQAVKLLQNKLQQKYTLITLSEKGIYWHDGKRSEIMPTEARNISDVCGAGDTVISVAALGLAAGWSMQEISRLSNLAGGQVCESVGVVSVNQEKLAQEYRQLLTRLNLP